MLSVRSKRETAQLGSVTKNSLEDHDCLYQNRKIASAKNREQRPKMIESDRDAAPSHCNRSESHCPDPVYNVTIHREPQNQIFIAKW